MLPTTYQYLLAGYVWILFFTIIYFYRSWIKKRLKNISNCYKIRFNWFIYLMIILYSIFVIFNIIGIIEHRIVPWVDYLILFIVMGFIGPIAEEIIFRGFFLGFFKQKLSLKSWKLFFWIMGVNVFFAWIHNFANPNPKPLIELIKTFLLGIIVSVVYLKSKKNILYPILIHLLHNVIRIYFILNF